MHRLEQLRQVIDEIIRNNPDREESRCGFVHLYGVSTICTLLALKRGLDVELCTAAGMLHDIWSYQVADDPHHATLGAVEAQKILQQLGSFATQEVEIICSAISTHSDKQSVHGKMAELLKDADLLQHYLYNPALYFAPATDPAILGERLRRLPRLEGVLVEMGIDPGHLQRPGFQK